MLNRPGLPPRCLWTSSAASDPHGRRAGFSLLEIIVAVTLLVLIMGVATTSFLKSGEVARKNACYTNVREIELQVHLWYRHRGTWPAGDLRDIGSDNRYFPDGLPACPVSGARYVLDRSTGRVVEHTH